MFGDTVGTFSDGFGRVSEKSSEEVEKITFSKMSGCIFPASGCPKQSFGAYSRRKNVKQIKI